jgi:hypothetical protein
MKRIMKKLPVGLTLIFMVSALILLSVVSPSCSRMPAAFWKNYHPELILEKSSDQGPWGGVRKIVWKSETANTFTAKQLIDYAAQNGWQLADSLILIGGSLEIPANASGTDYSLSILQEEALQLLNATTCRIFLFKTGWIAVEPGNARDTEITGFLVLNPNGDELAMFHRWGE